MQIPHVSCNTINRCVKCHVGHNFSYSHCSVCHRGIEISTRKEIAHYRLIPGRFAHFRFKDRKVILMGRSLIHRCGCRRCHRILGRGNALAIPIDGLSKDIEIDKIINNLKTPPFYMPVFDFNGEQIISVVNVVLRGIFLYKYHGEPYYIIHFKYGGSKNIFVQKCGGCHKILTKHMGGMGNRDMGPNLSGLFTPYYPFKDIALTKEKLKLWIKNPRKIRKNALMPPVDIEDVQLKSLIDILKN